MRIATYNVEWFDRLFDDEGRLRNDSGWSARWDVTRAMQTDALVRVFAALDADAVLVIEAPDTSRRRDGLLALESFAAYAGIRARAALQGFANHTQQEITLLYDPDIFEARHDPQTHGGAPRFDGTFRIDLDIDARTDRVEWSKPPLEAALHHRPSGTDLRLIGVHAKSKSPRGATDPDEILRLSIANRRKQLAQCIWLRRRVEAHLEEGVSLIVAGDFNDGPGLDRFEELFGRSGVEIVRGAADEVQLYDPHADADGDATSARFWLTVQRQWLEEMLDFIMVSPDLAARHPDWRVWHPLRDRTIRADAVLADALLTASDHFPVTLDVAL
ncbi:endonuclease/exonuclease/phosphatase family protein [Maribius pontilimi]|uniref:Endonuclease/exonuclease/phosphatase family protein n=1 Tax=Palleronia pontilimi TaxID=1964209 RepID=A0A934ID68_9RHOB|nr:endonuclease/exonuclease/phosphatase family protein [Palleronia pontilimi]MBJ3762292.1 endonuclease/exonuclease/phosphatase family protein [Palleronia pontilimi]